MKQPITHPLAVEKHRQSGYLLFAIVVISCVFIVVMTMNDVLTVSNNPRISSATTALLAHCGMDAQTFMQVSPMAQVGVEAQCDSPAEMQP